VIKPPASNNVENLPLPRLLGINDMVRSNNSSIPSVDNLGSAIIRRSDSLTNDLQGNKPEI